jgi:hypothetical protein
VTRLEAFERAGIIWGPHRLISVWVRPDGGADVNLRPSGIASETAARHYSAHRLDVNGHVVCHDDCRTLEPRARVFTPA